MRLILLFFASIVGVPKDLVQARITGIGNAALSGFQILLTAAVAWMNGAWCAYTVVFGSPFAAAISVCAGSIWAAIICTLDISLLRSVNKLSPGSKRQIRMRLVLASVIGLTLSTPTELLVCSPVIEHAIRGDRRAEINAEAAENASIEHLHERRSEAERDEEALAVQERRLDGAPDTFEYRDASRQLSQAEALYTTTLARDVPRVFQLKSEAQATQDESKRQSNREIIRQLQEEERTVRAQRDEAHRRLETAERAWNESEHARLASLSERAQHSSMASQRAMEKAQTRDAESESALNGILGDSFINRFLAFEHIKWNFSNRDCAGLWIVSFGLDSLFMLIEMLPILIKMNGDPTPLDHAMHNRTQVEIHRDNLMRSSELKALQAAAEVRDQALQRLLESNLRRIADPNTTSEELKEMKEQSKVDLAA